jgi:hypothetical protein
VLVGLRCVGGGVGRTILLRNVHLSLLVLARHLEILEIWYYFNDAVRNKVKMVNRCDGRDLGYGMLQLGFVEMVKLGKVRRRQLKSFVSALRALLSSLEYGVTMMPPLPPSEDILTSTISEASKSASASFVYFELHPVAKGTMSLKFPSAESICSELPEV